ncbi:MAG: hypothetical protein AMK72_09930 [Planctomycetes bacterium SM23_25]|nr:MAG: hypothetical protein AMK72_09930 [Planctomycetes bacterium SM23_25]
MKNAGTKRSVAVLLTGCLLVLAAFTGAYAQDADKELAAKPRAKATRGSKKKPEAKDKKKEPVPVRKIRVAVFKLDVIKGVEVDPAALTDQINTMLAALPKVTIVNRDRIAEVAAEHTIALTGLVDTETAVKLGKFLNAQYIAVGRASKIGQTFYIVLKVVDVETTVQTTVSAKGSVQKGFDAVLTRLSGALTAKIKQLQRPVVEQEDPALAKVRKAAKVLAGKVVLVQIEETHVNRPLRDPAAQLAVTNRLKGFGLKVIVPKDPEDGWKKALLETGKFAEKKVHYLLEGEGISAFAAELHGMRSCRARVELRLIAVPGRTVTVAEKGVGAKVDLVEALAAKAALEDAGASALDAVILQLAKQKDKGAAGKKKD